MQKPQQEESGGRTSFLPGGSGWVDALQINQLEAPGSKVQMSKAARKSSFDTSHQRQ